MANELSGKKIAFMATTGFEQIELTVPWRAIQEAGGEPVLVSIESGTIHGFNGLDKADPFDVDATFDQSDAGDYAGLVMPGGVANGDYLRANPDAVQFARSFFEAGKPVGAICHAAWTLAEADVVRGRRMTSWPSLQTDLRNAGADWVDEEVVTDNGLVTSRKPDDLDAFCAKIVEEFAEGRHEEQRKSA